MTQGWKIGLAVGIPVVLISTVGAIIYVQSKKRQRNIDNFILQHSSGTNTVTYVTPSGEQVTKPESQVNWSDLADAGIKIIGLFDRSNGDGGFVDDPPDYEPEFEMK